MRRTGLNNVRETWDENERKLNAGNENREENSELDETIKEEAAEYDHADKVSRTLGGDRATVSDDDSA